MKLHNELHIILLFVLSHIYKVFPIIIMLFVYVFLCWLFTLIYKSGKCYMNSKDITCIKEQMKYRFEASKLLFSQGGCDKQNPLSLISQNESEMDNQSYNTYSSVLNSISQYCKYKERKFLIKFILRRGQGLANNLRVMRGLLLLAMVNNATFCTDKYEDYYSVMNESLNNMICPKSHRFLHWSEIDALQWIKSNPCNYYLNESTEISTCYDLSNYFIHCNNIISDLSNVIHSDVYRNYLEVISNYFFQPKQYLIDYAESILLSMHGIKVGIQLRFGGSTALSKEKWKFLDPNKFELVIQQLRGIFLHISSPYSVFLSSDSLLAMDMLKPLNISFFTANEYQLGHTGKSNTTHRAVVDIYILSRCNILAYTYRSSYGRFARDLSKSNQVFVLKT